MWRMTLLVSATDRTRAAYHAASDTYDHPALSFWSHFGRTTIANLRLAAGARVLDVCCGSGASALPAAETVGKDGQVLGIDLAPGLINLARSKACRTSMNSGRNSATTPSFA
jgi:ubiquinone/menaquinone biosynthesis C-methylase UbiE